jgi:hypothetical protein
MSKEEYYSKIKRFVYRKFNELEVVERNLGDALFLRYNNEPYAQIRINIKSGNVYYYRNFRNKFIKVIHMENSDFEILLGKWIEETFQIKVSDIIPQKYTIILID